MRSLRSLRGLQRTFTPRFNQRFVTTTTSVNRALAEAIEEEDESVLRDAVPDVNKSSSTTEPQEAPSLTLPSYGSVRTDWSRSEVESIYNLPLLELCFQAAAVHRLYFDPQEVQQSTLLSIKTGGCSENCGYCSQSSHHSTFVKPTPTMKVEEVLQHARKAKEAGSTRFCMGSAWREVGKKHAFKRVLEMVKEINGMGMEVCTTLGMLTPEQAKELKAAGLKAYNHNLDTSREYYKKVVQTRTYDDRLETIKNVREAGINVCSGGIIGMGEEGKDRVGLLHTLATLDEHPESVPINSLVAVPGTPLGDAIIEQGTLLILSMALSFSVYLSIYVSMYLCICLSLHSSLSHSLTRVFPFHFGKLDIKTEWTEMIRMIATARILMPKSMVRLSAGRKEYSQEAQAMMFMCGANSLFTGATLLTTPNPEFDEDKKMFETLGLKGKEPHKEPSAANYNSALKTMMSFADGDAGHKAPSESSSSGLSDRKLKVLFGPGLDEFTTGKDKASSEHEDVVGSRGIERTL
eukprot:g1593.t1